MNIRNLLHTLFISCMPVLALSQKTNYSLNVQKYIEDHKEIAMREQLRTGIPAAIKLGQGILETAGGQSELRNNANNHFGIKCKKEWQGETYSYTDDRPNECFRKYKCTEDSYQDHSNYLVSSKRYAELFTYDITDYKNWAHCLKRCGYATNPRYAQILIKIIEDNKLYDYTLLAKNMPPKPEVILASSEKNMVSTTGNKTIITNAANNNVPATIENTNNVVVEKTTTITSTVNGKPLNQEKTNEARPATPQQVLNNDGIFYVNGLRAVRVKKGEMLLGVAMKYNIRYSKLLELNELPDAPLEADMNIFLDRKKSKGANETYTIKKGQSLLQVAQEEGILLRFLRQYNYLDKDELPAPGSVLHLWSNAPGKAVTTKIAEAASVRVNPAENVALNENSNSSYIATTKGNTFNEPARIVETGAAQAVEQAEPVAETVKAETPKVVEQANPAEQVYPAERNSAPTAERTDKVSSEPETIVVAATAITSSGARYENVEKEPVHTATEEPKEMDEFEALKAKMDKSVYSSNTARTNTAAPTVTTPNSTGTTTSGSQEATATTAAVYHTVKSGDTFFSIAKKYNISVAQLKQANNINNFDQLKAGQKLRVN